MAKVGRVVTDPKAGAHCYLTLDDGHRIVVSHDPGGAGGGCLTIEEVRWWGLVSGATLIRFDFESLEGREALARLLPNASVGRGRASPLGAFVDYLRDCRSLREVGAKCKALLFPRPPPAA